MVVLLCGMVALSSAHELQPGYLETRLIDKHEVAVVPLGDGQIDRIAGYVSGQHFLATPFS